MGAEEQHSVIDLTLSSDDESQSEQEIEKTISPKTPFDPPLNISGNILESRHYKILKSHSAWFTDDIINAFFCILQSKYSVKCFVFSSFFYESLLRRGKEYCLKHWTRGVKTFLSTVKEDGIVLLPVNSGGSHWVLVAWFLDEGVLKYYDSLMCRRSGNRIMKQMTEFFNEMLNAEDDDLEKLLSILSIDEVNDSKTDKQKKPLIKNNLIPKGQVQQTDGSSCGQYCCLNGKRLLEEPAKLGNFGIYEFRTSLIEYFKENAK